MLSGVLRRRAAERVTAANVAKHDDPAAEPGKSALDIVKWVVPSIGVFAALVGFVSESAHQALLGVERGDIGAAAYIWSAGEFIRAVIRAVSSAVFLPRFFSADSTAELWLLAVAIGIGLALYLLRRLKDRNTRPPLWRRVVFSALLIALVACRLLIVEVPLARVENLLVGGTRVVENSLRLDKVTPAEQAILKRSAVFYSFLLCDRQTASAVPGTNLQCERGRQYGTDAVRLLLVVIGISIATLAIVGLLWAGASTTTAAVLLAPVALYCCLAPAFVYGKLVKPPLFESALIQVKTGLEQMPAQTSFNGRPAVQDTSAGRLLTAIILGRDDKMLSLYVSQSKACGAEPSTYEWVPWQIPVSELIAMREIQSLDVVAERFKQVPCPDSPLPP